MRHERSTITTTHTQHLTAHLEHHTVGAGCEGEEEGRGVWERGRVRVRVRVRGHVHAAAGILQQQQLHHGIHNNHTLILTSLGIRNTENSLLIVLVDSSIPWHADIVECESSEL
jgi:hypothetical protein